MSSISLKRATILNVSSKYVTVIINILVTAILSRILTPNDYGIVAVITVFTNLFSILSEMGIGPAIIQNKSLTKSEIDDIFSFTAMAGIVLAGGFALLSIPIAIFFDDNVYYPIVMILSVSVYFNTINMVPNALLYRKQKFMAIAVRTVSVCVATSIIAIVLAFMGAKYYTLVIQSTLSSLFLFIWNVWGSNLHLKLRVDFQSVKKIRGYSTYQFLFSITNYFSRNVDNISIGKFLGNECLAYYDKSYKLMMYPLSNLTFVINPVLHPILSVHQDDLSYIYRKYINVIKMFSALGALIQPICFVCAQEIILILYGPQWESAVPSFMILSCSIWAQIISSSAGAIYQSINKTKLMFQSSIVHVCITLILIFACLFKFRTIEGVSIAVAFAYILKFFIEYYFLINKGFGKSFLAFLSGLIPNFVSIIFTTLLGVFLCKTLSSVVMLESAFAGILLKSAIIAVVWLISVIITGEIRILLEILGVVKKNG